MQKISEFVSVLDHDTVKNTCVVCPRIRKLQFDDKSNFGTIYDSCGKKMCKRCLISLARKNLAYNYVMDYFRNTGKRYFTVLNMKSYMNDTYDEEEVKFVSQSLPIVLRELISHGYIEIFRDRNCGRRYKLVSEKIEVEAEEFKAEILTKGFGFVNGVKVDS